MANVTENPQHGYINSTHISHMTPYYPTGNLPTPWPVILVSVLVSLAISCYSCKSTMVGLSAMTSGVRRVRDYPRSPFARKRQREEPVLHETELYNLHTENRSIDPPPPYQSEGTNFVEPQFESISNVLEDEHPNDPSEAALPSVDEPQAQPKWKSSPRKKAIELTIFTFSTFRAFVAFIIALKWLVTKNTSLSSPANLLLLLVSIQIQISNPTMPRAIRGILTLSAFLVAVSFCITGFAPLAMNSTGPANGSTYPAYGNLAISGGICPVYASNCFQQTTHWAEVGCGNYTTIKDIDDNDDDAPNPTTGSFTPYATSGDVNSKMNPLHIVETVILVFGALWLLSVVFQVYESRYLIRPRTEAHPKKRKNLGSSCMGIVAFLGIIGAIVATFMTIGAHIGQEVLPHHAVYLDSFGPAVVTNGSSYFNYTVDEWEINIGGPTYRGNATSWSDCFVLEAPRSGDGGWRGWVDANRGSLFRIPAGV